MPVPNPRPATLFGSGKVEELAGLMRAEDAEPRHRRSSAHAGAAAQSRNRVERQGARPHRADPRNFRRARADAGRAPASRACPSRLSEEPAGPLLDASRAAARRLRLSRRPRRDPDRDRPPPARRAHRRHPQGAGAGAPAPARCIANRASACPIRPWRWSATPMPASRPCSTR